MDNNPPPNNPNNNPGNNAREQAIDRLTQANNVLVTVSNNPSVDQLAACIGLTLMLNKLGKHGTAVFSGQVPSTIEFLKPEATIEKNTDSLRDFIIALDKSKADKLRYKVEDKVVKIFITPYKTSISDKDLEFSQGDFNVDVVVALGVRQQQDLDQAITAHGRILHDATVISVSNTQPSNLGSMAWTDNTASSLSELVAQLDGQLGNSVMDGQIATALLTGIVAETDRFSNKKTSSQTMSVSAKLMSAGANQQLVATKLEQPKTPPPAPVSKAPASSAKPAQPVATTPTKKTDDGAIKIDHAEKPAEKLEPAEDSESEESEIHIDDEGTIHNVRDEESAQQPPPGPGNMNVTGGSPMITQRPTWDSKLTANSEPDSFDQGHERSTDPMSLPSVEPPMLSRDDATNNQPQQAPTANGLDNARDAVNAAGPSSQLTPRDDLNAKPVFDDLQPAGAPSAQPVPAAPNVQPGRTLDMPTPSPTSTDQQPAYEEDRPSGAPPAGNTSPGDNGANPPPVPPPMVPPVF